MAGVHRMRDAPDNEAWRPGKPQGGGQQDDTIWSSEPPRGQCKAPRYTSSSSSRSPSPEFFQEEEREAVLSLLGRLGEGQERLEAGMAELRSGQRLVAGLIQGLSLPLVEQPAEGGVPAWLEGDPGVKAREQRQGRDRRDRLSARLQELANLPLAQPQKLRMEGQVSYCSGASASAEGRISMDGGLRASVAASLGLEGGWPKNVRLREQLCGQRGAIQSRIDSRRSYLLDRTMTHEDLSERSEQRRKCSLVLEPSSTLRLLVDLTSLFVLCYDLTVTPWVLAWSVPFQGLVKAGTYATMAFWCFDMALSFRTGFYKLGELEMRPGQIAQKYMRTFFVPDLLITVTDFANIALNAMEDSAPYSPEGMRLLRLIKAGRLLRILGVLRLGHCMEVLSRINDRHALWGDTTYFLAEVAVIIATILWLNHIVACVWFLLGDTDGGDTGYTWLDEPIGQRQSGIYRDAGRFYQYVTAFHWSVTQMTPGSMQVSPVNSGERGFNIICLIFGMLIFGTLVSSLSAKMMHLKMSMQESNKRLVTLRRFLRSSGVSPQLAVGIQKQAIERQKLSRKPLTVSEVSLLGLLSLSMRTELMWELSRPHLMRHPIFRLFEMVDTFAIKKICREAVDFIVLSPADTLFQPGGEAQSAFFVVSGTLRYVQDTASSPVRNDITKDVTPGMRLCEAALWTIWTHVGTAEAVDVCQLMCIDVKKFVSVLSGRTLIQEVAYEYALEYHKRLTECSREEYWPSDIEVPFTEFHEIMISMKSAVQIFLGLMIIRMANSVMRLWSRDRSLAELEEEVRQRRCIVLVNDAGEIQRVTALTVMRMYDADGERILAQLGKVEGGHSKAKCTLPGMKVGEGGGELNTKSLERLLQKRLAPFAPFVVPQTHSCLTEVLEEESGCGFQTQYIKTIHSVSVSDEFDMAALGLEVLSGDVEAALWVQRKGAENLTNSPKSIASSAARALARCRVTAAEEASKARKARRSPSKFDASELPSHLEVFFLGDAGDKGAEAFKVKKATSLVPISESESLPVAAEPSHVASDKPPTVCFFAWLKPKEFDFFSSPDGGEVLKHLVAALEVDDDFIHKVLNPRRLQPQQPQPQLAVVESRKEPPSPKKTPAKVTFDRDMNEFSELPPPPLQVQLPESGRPQATGCHSGGLAQPLENSAWRALGSSAPCVPTLV